MSADRTDLHPVALATITACAALGAAEAPAVKALAAADARAEELRAEVAAAEGASIAAEAEAAAAEGAYKALRNDAAWAQVERARAAVDRARLGHHGAAADLDSARGLLAAALRDALAVEIAAARAARLREIAPAVALMAVASRHVARASRDLDGSRGVFPPRGLQQRAALAGVPSSEVYPLRLVVADAAALGATMGSYADNLGAYVMRALAADDDDAHALRAALDALDPQAFPAIPADADRSLLALERALRNHNPDPDETPAP